MSDQPGVMINHIKAGSYMDEQVDQFDAFAISWNGQEAIHLTFGRTSINVKSSKFVPVPDGTERQSGDVEIFRLDVGAVSMPLDTAKHLSETLIRMIAQAETRRVAGEQ
ncbi:MULTISPECIES: hypothetical protein [unclassified Pseudomonas]|uniref:hypothetical protein n=1 Tax=unclassified Pseudomonas TaxID=196821 RepID=UPI001B33DD01|nr:MULTISPECIES: hypothetical protein [unclassified Pseudomonas]MBP5948510.1 hypothetical protein [Pseudomonas sp. P9(2020)]MBZ9560762.1 hypothetical protein [Pseudomonas sp. P116]